MGSRSWVMLLAFLWVACGRPARAEDEPPEPPPPPALEEGAEAFQGETDPTDLLEYVKTLRRSLREYETPPDKTDRVTALYDAWYAILRPRARRMTKRLERWEQPKRWFTPSGEAQPVALDPDEWSQFTRDMSQLVTELHGAWKQYGSVQLKDKEVGIGTTALPRPPRIYRYGYAYPELYRVVRNRQLAGWHLGRWDMRSYWHLLNRFHAAWLWRLEQRRLYYEWHAKQERIRQQTFEDLRNELNNTQDALGGDLLGVKVLVAAMQNAEEERLMGTCEACKHDATFREMAEVALREMEDARQEAELYEGDSSSQYGSLLRKWLRARTAAVRVLDMVGDQWEESGAAPTDVDPDAAEAYAEAAVPEPKPFARTRIRADAAAQGEFDDLPAAGPSTLAALLGAWAGLKAKASASPGRFTGGPAGESYWPTKPELRLAELGDRIEQALVQVSSTAAQTAWTEAGLGDDALSFQTFREVTVKVFGTGYVTVLEPRAKAISRP